ncbi:hypothetical protein JTB14_030202 [Gonioctena quinquepunctata]|nr:hypothetical protein JTB14_030202 [Gonioctena quinquepunctata]
MLSDPFRDKKRLVEIKLAGLLATNNLLCSLMDVLSPLCGDLFPESEVAKAISVRRTKSTQILKQTLGMHFEGELYNRLQEPGCWFSIIMDETTDIGSKKQCAFSEMNISLSTKE